MTAGRSYTAGLEPWLGRTVISVGRAAYLGPASDTTPHSHHALQASVGINGPVRMRAPGQAWREFDAALVPPDVAHQLDASGCPVLLIYLEPESDEGRRWLRTTDREISALDCADAVRATLHEFPNRPSTEINLREAMIRVLQSAGISALSRSPSDARVGLAIRLLRDEASTFGSPSELAREVGLSPSRFRHLFREQVGISTQSYIVWLRLYRACKALARGASLSGAALEAGFADGAHFTRTFRRTFGLAPSQIAGRIEFLEPESIGAIS